MPSKPPVWPDALTKALWAQNIREAQLWAHWFYGNSTHQGLGPWECCEQVAHESV